jgi:plasmid maintenance system antidote protein VapI
MPGQLFLEALIEDAKKTQKKLADCFHRAEVIIQKFISEEIISLEEE